jgi:hypothetical protein
MFAMPMGRQLKTITQTVSMFADGILANVFRISAGICPHHI